MRSSFMRHSFLLLISCFALFCTEQSSALIFPLQPGQDVVGKVQTAEVQQGDDFYKMAQRYDMGYYELMAANPGVDTEHPSPGTVIVIPSQFVLPPVARKGIVINQPEMRIYYFPPDGQTVMTFPIGIGREGPDTVTPEGILTIIQKRANPSWTVPKSIKAARASEGIDLPDVMPPGPDNPLGKFMMRLSNYTYLIHGTNDPTGVGQRSSSGCIRLYPEDIETLFRTTPTGTQVHIINMPYKAGWRSGQLYLEAHLPLPEQQRILQGSLEPAQQVINAALRRNNGRANVDWGKATHVARDETGVPEIIATAANTSVAVADDNF